MARGKQSLAETVDEEDIITSDEIMSEPNILITDDFGISGKFGDYALVQRKVAHRTGKKEDGDNEGKVIRYIKWEDINYSPTPFGCLISYFEYVNLAKTKRLKLEKDFSKVAEIYKETQNEVRSCIKKMNLSKETIESGTLSDEIDELKSKLNKINEVLAEADEFRQMIKDKTKIVIDATEPKKHRMKLEK